MIGNTPIIKLHKIVPENSAEVWLKYKAVNPSKVKKGKYKTIFGNKRKVVGYGGKTPYIKKKLPARMLGTAFTVPGFAAMNIGLGAKKDKKGARIIVAIIVNK